jgi:prophage antirepressor-like protein
MMNELQVFSYEGNEIRTVQKDNETWWVLKDVCDILELSNPSMIADRLDDDEKVKVDPKQYLGSRSNEPITIISESGLYNVILLSRKPEAKKFKRWVTHEVLPSIRAHGAYMTPKTVKELVDNPDLLLELVLRFKKEQAARAEQARLLEEKTEQLDESKEWLTVKRVAKLNGVHWKTLDWKRLKNTSQAMEYDVKKVFDANYGNVNAYHIDVWRHEYGGLRYAAD